MGPLYTVTREVADAPEEGESGTIYEFVIRDIDGQVVARTYDAPFAKWVTQQAEDR